MIIESMAYAWFLLAFGTAVLLAEFSGRYVSRGFQRPWGRWAMGIMCLTFASLLIVRGTDALMERGCAGGAALAAGTVWLFAAALILLRKVDRETQDDAARSLPPVPTVLPLVLLVLGALALFLGAGLAAKGGETAAAWLMRAIAVALTFTAGVVRLRQIRGRGSARKGTSATR